MLSSRRGRKWPGMAASALKCPQVASNAIRNDQRRPETDRWSWARVDHDVTIDTVELRKTSPMRFPSTPSPQADLERGFSLIELMIVLVIVALLLMVALPSYQDSVRKGRRAEAFTSVSTIQQAQERWRANNTSYTLALADIGANANTPNGHYSLALSAPRTATINVGFTVIATATGGQAADTGCAKMAVELVRGNLSYGSGASTIDWTDPKRCWAK